ncbi:MAG: hypothetical protein ABJE95_21170 [Byssovorax sp.]
MISLESYAAVLAGLGAGLRLGRALSLSEVPAPAWESSSEHWQARIDESAASDLELLVAFDGALSTARRRFEPTIEPITSDPYAWAQFRRHFITAVDPVAFLAERQLSLSAQARLEADWTTRVLADPALAAALQGHMDAPLAECPALTVTPSPWLLETSAAPLPNLAPSPALPEVAPLPVAAPVVKPSYLLDAPTPPAVPRPVAAPRRKPAMDLGRTRIVPDAPKTAPMPFFRPADASPVLPFQGPTTAPVITTAVSPPRAAAGPRVDLGQTVGPSLTPVTAAVPFRPADPEAQGLTLEQYAALVAARQKAGGPTPAFFAHFGLDAERHAALDAYWTRRFAANGMLALDFGRFVAAAQKSLETVAAPPVPVAPIVPVAPVAPVVPVVPPEAPSPLPDLTVEQYAWIVARLRQAAPPDLPAVLVTLRLTPETRELLEAHWRARMARDTALQQAFILALGRFLKGNAKTGGA